MIRLFKDGDSMAIITDAPDEQAFVFQMADLLSRMLASGDFFVGKDANDGTLVKVDNKKGEITGPIDEVYANDWEFQFRFWLPQIVDLCCKYRGYKNTIQEKKLMMAGAGWFKGDEPVASIGEDKNDCEE
jgi:hypothetical protein